MNIGDDILDSRDIDECIAELEGELANLISALNGAEDDEERGSAQQDIDAFKESDDGKDLESLIEFREEVNSSEWEYGLALIHSNYFQEYAEELAYDIGAIARNATWPLNRINWKDAADDLLIDYSKADLIGHTYYYRDC